jgi:hypothetical protein
MFAASGGTTSEFIIFPHKPHSPLRAPIHLAAKLGDFGGDPSRFGGGVDYGTGPNPRRSGSWDRTRRGQPPDGGTDRGNDNPCHLWGAAVLWLLGAYSHAINIGWQQPSLAAFRVSRSGVVGKQRWAVAVAQEKAVAEVRRHIPLDATAELSD